MRKDGDDWKEGNEQEYFLEIEYAGQSVDSDVINVNDSAPKIKVAEPAVSMTGVGASKEEKNNQKKICECEAKVRAFLRLIMVKESEQMAMKFGYSPYEINVGGKSFIRDHGKITPHIQEFI